MKTIGIGRLKAPRGTFPGLPVRASALVVACIVLGAIPTIVQGKARIDHGRYYSPDSEFSMVFDYQYWPTKEYTSDRLTVVEFPYRPNATIHGFFRSRTLEWLKLDKALVRSEYRSAAEALIRDRLEHRYQKLHLAIQATALVFDQATPEYRFIALEPRPDGWGCLGIMMFLDERIAIFTELIAPIQSVDHKYLDPLKHSAFFDWAESLRREPAR